jgi:hypothetical protein
LRLNRRTVEEPNESQGKLFAQYREHSGRNRRSIRFEFTVTVPAASCGFLIFGDHIERAITVICALGLLSLCGFKTRPNGDFELDLISISSAIEKTHSAVRVFPQSAIPDFRPPHLTSISPQSASIHPDDLAQTLPTITGGSSTRTARCTGARLQREMGANHR